MILRSLTVNCVCRPAEASLSHQTHQEFGLKLAASGHLAAEAHSLNEPQTEGLRRIYNKNNETQIEGALFKRLIK